ncbi:MAG: hypothetical protein WB511_02560, partial [Nitrososphaeraceae archaeon]
VLSTFLICGTVLQRLKKVANKPIIKETKFYHATLLMIHIFDCCMSDFITTLTGKNIRSSCIIF